MQNSGIIIFLKGIITGWLILFAFFFIKDTLDWKEANHSIVRQMTVLRKIQREYVDKGKSIPANLSELTKNENDTIDEIIEDMQYFPEAAESSKKPCKLDLPER